MERRFDNEKISANVLADLLENFTFISKDFQQIYAALYEGADPHEFHECWDPFDRHLPKGDEEYRAMMVSTLGILGTLGDVAEDLAKRIRIS